MANPQHHRPMAQDQDLEGRLGRRITPADEPFEQLPVGKAARGPGVEQRLDVAQNRDGWTTSHLSEPRSSTRCQANRQVVPGTAPSYPFILGKSEDV